VKGLYCRWEGMELGSQKEAFCFSVALGEGRSFEVDRTALDFGAWLTKLRFRNNLQLLLRILFGHCLL